MKNLVLTARGRRFKKSVPEKLWSGETMFAALSADERSQLTDILAKLAAQRP